MYQLIRGFYSLEGIPYTSYGIQCDQFRMEDLSLDREVVAQLVRLCNEHMLESIQLPDIVDDFLAAPDAFHWASAVQIPEKTRTTVSSDQSEERPISPCAPDMICPSGSVSPSLLL